MSDAVNEMFLQNISATTDSSGPEPLQDYQKFLSGTLHTMHYEYNVPFDGLEVLQNLLFENHKKLSVLKMVS